MAYLIANAQVRDGSGDERNPAGVEGIHKAAE